MKSTIKEKFLRILPFLTLFFVWFIIHMHLPTNTGDDIYFSNINISGNGLITHLKIRYNTWSSRLVIEFLVVVMFKLPKFIWAILDSLIIVLLVHSLTYLFTNNSTKYRWIFSALFFIYPFENLSTAGWLTTTLFCLWPLAFGMYCFIPIKNILIDKKENIFKYILYSLSLIYACNQEQMCALVLGFYLVFFIYIWKTKKFNPYLFVQLMLSFAIIIFTLTCPGNTSRTTSETNYWLPDYAKYTLFDKIFNGIVTAFCFYFNFPTLILCTLLAITPFILKKQWLCKLVSIIPFIIYSILFVIKSQWFDFFAKINTMINQSYQLEKGLFAILLLLGAIVFFATMVASIYMNLEDKNDKYLFSLILMAGVASRIIMGFSPTVFASFTRPYIFMFFAMIIIIYKLIQIIIDKYNGKLKKSKNLS